ncbi:AAA family ATPase [Brumimicrobium aurantiacum]|nr:AAA family ATPase [Brumimicrobium aurantiacum]
MHFHQKIHELLLTYREKHNKNFKFLVRQRASTNDKKYPGGKFAHGLVFQGTEKYCFVGLLDKSGGANSTKSGGLVISPTQHDGFKAHFEIVFPGIEDLEIIAFYKELAAKFAGIKWDKKGERAWLNIGEFTIDDPSLLYKWLDKNYSIITETASNSRIENIIPNEVRFKKLQDNLELRLKSDRKPINYWIYSPGRSAEHWNSFYEEGIMAIGWDELGDLSQYDTKDDIYSALQENYGGEGSKKNNVAANFEFSKEIKIGDIVIVKKGKHELLGYGIVTSDYYHNNSKEEYKSSRTVDWKVNGNWKTSHSLVLKTLTNITNYKSDGDNYEFFYQRLMALMKGEKKELETIQNPKKSINQILFGPPGTGKTYFLKDQLFDNYTVKETSISKEQHFENVVSNSSWWQVIGIALLEIGDSKVTEIFNNKWIEKKASLSNSKTIRPTLWGQLQSHTINECEFVKVANRQQPLIFNKREDSTWEILEDEVKELAPELYDIKDSVDNYNPNPDKIIKNYDFVTFHQSFAYEDFIEGIKPILPENEAEESIDLGYKIEDGVFKKLCLKAKNDSNNRYAIFIDEINRGNVSAIFGELITLIEIDKRTGAKNELSIKLPYSKELFSVPSNLDIYGTMNTADRSVEALDTALRRRFSFQEMMPNPELLTDIEIEGINLAQLLTTINERIEVLVDRDHTIGHSYFLNVKSKEDLKNVFKDKVIPLLQEYFFGDYSKMEMVIGSYFFMEKLNKVTFAVSNDNYFEERKRYVFKDFDQPDFDIITALKGLLGIKEENKEE